VDFYLHASLAPFFIGVGLCRCSSRWQRAAAPATLGVFLAVLLIGLGRYYMDAKGVRPMGWGEPFHVSLIQLAFLVHLELGRKGRRNSRR